MQGKNTVVFVTGKNPLAAGLISKEINEDKDFVSVTVPFNSLVTKPKIALAKSKRVLNNYVWKPITKVLHRIFHSVNVAKTMTSYDGSKKQRVHNMIYRYSPTILVVSEPYVLYTLTENIKKMGKKPNIFVLSNDIGFNFDLVGADVRHYFVDNINTRNQLLQKGIFADKIDVEPLAIERKFFEEKDKDEVRQKMGLGKNTKVVLAYIKEKNRKELVDYAVAHAETGVFIAICDAFVKEYAEANGITCFNALQEQDLIAACDVVLSAYDPYVVKKAAAMKKTTVLFGEESDVVKQLEAEEKVRYCSDTEALQETLEEIFAPEETKEETAEEENENEEESEETLDSMPKVPVFDDTDINAATVSAERMKELIRAMNKEEERF